MHFFIPQSFLLTIFSPLKVLIVQWWFNIKNTKIAQTARCTSYYRRIKTTFHAIWRRSSFNSTSAVGKNAKITFAEECILIEMVAMTHWFQNHYWIVNVIFLQIVWNLTTSQIIKNLMCFFLLKQFEKKCSKWLIVRLKINVQETKLVHSNNRTVPNKDRTYGTFNWKKIIVHVRLFSTRE